MGSQGLRGGPFKVLLPPRPRLTGNGAQGQEGTDEQDAGFQVQARPPPRPLLHHPPACLLSCHRPDFLGRSTS